MDFDPCGLKPNVSAVLIDALEGPLADEAPRELMHRLHSDEAAAAILLQQEALQQLCHYSHSFRCSLVAQRGQLGQQ